MKFFLRFLAFSALCLAPLGLPLYSQFLAPSACAALATLSGWIAGYPEVVHGVRLQATPDAYFVEVDAECLGIETWLIFSAAVLAFSAPVRRRLNLLLISAGIVILLNSIRIACIYHLGLWSPVAAEWAHQWLFNTPFLIVYMALLYAMGVSGNGGFTAIKRHLTKPELEFWGSALILLTVSLVLWHMYGPATVAAVLHGLTKLLVNALSWGCISDVSVLPLRPELGWQFVLPAFSLGVDGGKYSAEIPFNYIAYLLFPLVSFALCQSLIDSPCRWQWQPWLYGLTVGMLWYGLGLVVTTIHIQSIAAMHVASPFSPYIDPPHYTLLAPAGLPTLFYGSGWLFEIFFTLSNVVGFALWAELALHNRPLAQVKANV